MKKQTFALEWARPAGRRRSCKTLVGASIPILGCLSLFSLTACTTESTATTADTETAAEPVVNTVYGQVRGEIMDGGIYAFRGIPYGGSTAGANRFKPPTKPEAWEGVRQATEWGDRSPQPAGRASDYGKMIGWDQHPGATSEDCLVLNVWTPAIGDGGKRPVMVSFHGGGFTSGSGNGHGYRGAPLASYGDVVVVSVNHRLGVLGFLYLGDIAGEEYAQSGNVGVLDLIASLEWVRDNIENFGGDPNNVMIFGQSGGGAKTSTLLAMPGAKGLFHRAAVQSGSSTRMRTREDATETAKKLLAELGIAEGEIEKLQSLPVADLIAAQSAIGSGGPGGGFAPVVDGIALPRHPFDPDAPEVSANVPMIIGWTLDEAALSLTNWDLDEDGLAEIAKRLVGDKADEALALYRGKYPDVPPYLVQTRMLTDRGFANSAQLQAARKAEQGVAPAYVYLWTWPSPGMGGKFGAVHGVDVALAFHNYSGEITGGGTDEGKAMADKLASAWVAFARTGNPNNPELPEWPVYNSETRPTMIFDLEARVENDPVGEMREFWASR